MPPGLDRFESFGDHKFTAKHCYFRCSRPPMLMGSKFLIKMTRLQNIKMKSSVLRPGHFYQNFDPINIRRPWAPEITMFSSEFIMTKTFKPIKNRRHWPSFDFISFSARPILVLGHPFFTPRVFLIRFHFFFNPSGLGLDSSMTFYSKSPF